MIRTTALRRLFDRPWWRELALLVLLGACAGTLPSLARPWMRHLMLDLGPNDREYTTGFREGWEREGTTRFHWTTRSSIVTLPVRLSGHGFLLRMRVRRHFLDPARVRLSSEGIVFHTFDIKSDPKIAYPLIETTLPDMVGRHRFVLSIDSDFRNPRPLGLAIDWIEISGLASSARIDILPDTSRTIVILVLLAYLLVRAAGGGARIAFFTAAAFLPCFMWGLVADTIALERVLRLGAGSTLATLAATALFLRFDMMKRVFGTDGKDPRGLLAVLVLAALVIRLIVVLHPRFYYPDVTVHGLLLARLNGLGLKTFLARYFESQFEFSLGLQMEKGNWYAFPYPPALYLFCWPVTRLGGYAYDVTVSLLPAVINSIEVLFVYALVRRLGFSTSIGSLASFFVPLLPLFITRLSYAYFPAIVGHAFDVAVILLLVSRIERPVRLQTVLLLASAFAVAMLTYTQSLLNFAILLPIFVASELITDRAPANLHRQAGLLGALILGGLLSLTVFYYRYLPVAYHIYHGTPMTEAAIKTEKDRMRASLLSIEDLAPENDDPDAGPDLDLARGLRKAARRLYRFYGFFAIIIPFGLVLVLGSVKGSRRRFVAVWASTYLILNLASGGLPGPNLVRYNKDLEIVAPLACLCLALVGKWLWSRMRLLGAVYMLLFVLFGCYRAYVALTEKFVLGR
jgi:hypothetical protein